MRRFTDWILSMNLENVSFKNTKIGQTGAIDANFLVRFSQNGENLKLIVEDREAVSSVSPISELIRNNQTKYMCFVWNDAMALAYGIAKLI